MIKQKIKELIRTALDTAYQKGQLPSDVFDDIVVEEPKISDHGDFSTNIAMVSASRQKMAPAKIAKIIIECINDNENIVEDMRIAGPGFLNFFIKTDAWYPVLERVHSSGSDYGACNIGKGKRVQVEFVSANPTGPLHIGHGRCAAVGDTVAAILSFCGFDVQREYYINDSGRQIRTLGLSVFLRYKALSGESITFPDDCYQGDYIIDLAKAIQDKKSVNLSGMSESEAIDYCAQFAAGQILASIRDDLKSFGVSFDRWYSEQSLYDSNKVSDIIEAFKRKKIIYSKDGAFWFATSNYQDEKDRVIVKNDGQTTYFASDIAYHQDKYMRGFDRVIDVWGADHHGYIPRMNAAVQACGYESEQLQVILVQLVNLLRSGEPVAMSTRAGEFVTLKDVVDEVGRDAARFIFLTRHYESSLDFDLETARKKTNDNPVYYVQYVHARISSIMRKAEEAAFEMDSGGNQSQIARVLVEPEEIDLIKAISRYPEVIVSSCEFLEPHRITYYLMELAACFHAYYNRHRVLADDPKLTRGRLYLITAVKKVIRGGLQLLGVSAPEKM